jgi:hypothetical protein
MIRKGEHGWEKFVPHKVAEAIKEQGLFDYPGNQTIVNQTAISS